MSEQIEILVEHLQNLLEEIDWMDRDVRPRLREPATDEEIAALTEQWRRPLPPSYEAFLRLCNGMEGADLCDWAIAGATEPPTGESFEDVKSGHVIAFKRREPKHPALRDVETMMVAGTDFDFQVVFWDRATIGNPEPRLRRLSQEERYDKFPLFADFEAFLSYVVDAYEELLMQMQGLEDEGYSKEDQALLMELASLLDAPKVEEEAPAVKLSPEMQLAADLCALALQKLVDRELVELVEGPSIREGLEDYLLRKLLRSSSERDTIDAWIDALSKAREVEELYGTDEELSAAMIEAFREIERRQS